MEVYLNRVDGIDDAIVSMFLSKRTLTRELENDIRLTCFNVNGSSPTMESREKYKNWMDTLVKWGWLHTTMLRFVDLSFTVYGLHRAGQDDWDSHAKRFDNRIIRSSTRLATYEEDEMSDWYSDKIITTDKALGLLEINIPNELTYDGVDYVKSVNGYIRKDMKDSKDAKRGLYMLSIPSNFIFKINLCEFAHVYKERNENGTANPEVKECCERCCDELEEIESRFNRELLEKIKN